MKLPRRGGGGSGNKYNNNNNNTIRTWKNNNKNWNQQNNYNKLINNYNQYNNTNIIITRNFSICWSCGTDNTDIENGAINFFCSNCGKIQDIIPKDGEKYISPFKVFGYDETFNINIKDMEKRYWNLQKQLHPDKFALSDETEQKIAGKQSTLVNESYDILKHPVQRGKVLLSMLHNVEPLGEDVGTGDVPMDLLMQVMEAREEIENLNSNDEKGASIIISKTIAMVDECANTFEHVLEVENNIEEASNLLVRLQYLCKIEEEIRKKCDELLK